MTEDRTGGAQVSREDRRATARRLARDGQTVRQIAGCLGVTPSTVYGWVPEAPETPQFREMAALRRQGLSDREIGAEVGVNRQRVSAVLGPLPRRKTRGVERLLNLAPETWQGASAQATVLGLRGMGGRTPGAMIGMMLDGIASGEIEVRWRDQAGPLNPLGGA